jgi:hypothetical protein
VQVVFLGALASEGLGPLVEAREDTMPAETFLFVVEDEAGAVVGPAQWGFLFGFWRVLGASFVPVALWFGMSRVCGSEGLVVRVDRILWWARCGAVLS